MYGIRQQGVETPSAVDSTRISLLSFRLYELFCDFCCEMGNQSYNETFTLGG